MQYTDRYDDVSARTNMEDVDTMEIDIEIEGNEVEINWQSDYLQAIWWSLAQTLHRNADIHSHYAKKEEKGRKQWATKQRGVRRSHCWPFRINRYSVMLESRNVL